MSSRNQGSRYNVQSMKNYVICVICFVLVFWARVDVGTSLGGGDCGMWGESEAVHRYCIE